MKVHTNSRQKFSLVAEINMVPLIDVSLVLLIIFMVVTPFLVKQEIKINLPKAVTSVQADSDPVKITINARRTYYIDGKAVLKSDLTPRIKTALAYNADRPVLIEADATVPFEYVVNAMDQAKMAGAQKLGVATTQSNSL